ncbi:flavodoxin family protein [Mollicutes bacterium LVI A0039]|nr:flavodoxin family protein [Mollicutes bacterium LVI A0039]
MKKILVYSSKTGNTKKIAESINNRIELDQFKTVKEFDVDSIATEDLIIVGGWIDKGVMNREVMELISKISNHKVAYFFTLGAYPTSMHAFDCVRNITAAFEANNNQVISHYHCQGAIDPKLMDWMKNLPKDHGHSPDQDRLNRWEDAAKHPNQEDFHAAENFANMLMKKLEELNV